MLDKITKIYFYLLEITVIIVADNSLHGKLDNKSYRKPKSGAKPFDTGETTTFRSQTVPLPSLQEYENATSSMSYIDARRINTFSNPANLQDPKFQELLSKYRGMVHKNSAPQQSQQLPSVQNFQQHQQYPNMKYGQAATFHYQYTMPGQKVGAQIPEYYGLPERYERKKDSINNIYKPWQSPLTLPIQYTTPRREQLPRYTGLPGLIKGHHPHWGYGIERQRTEFVQPSGGRPLPGLIIHSTEAMAPSLNATQGAGAVAAARYTTGVKTTTRRRRRTTPPRVSFEEECDYIAYYCLKAYDTGQLCGRTLYNFYSTFQNYCMLDFVNCMERYEDYPYLDDYFLDQYYIIEDM